MSEENEKEIDEGLIRDFLQGKEAAFEMLVYRYEKKLYTLCYHYMGSQEDTLDITQEIFLRVYRYLPKFRFEAAFSTWVYRLAINTCLDFIRKQKKVVLFPLEDSSFKQEEIKESFTSAWNQPEKELERVELGQAVRACLASLPEEQRAPLALKEFQEMSYAEISLILKIPLGTVRSRINRGRHKLKKIFIERELFDPNVYLNKQGEVIKI